MTDMSLLMACEAQALRLGLAEVHGLSLSAERGASASLSSRGGGDVSNSVPTVQTAMIKLNNDPTEGERM